MLGQTPSFHLFFQHRIRVVRDLADVVSYTPFCALVLLLCPRGCKFLEYDGLDPPPPVFFFFFMLCLRVLSSLFSLAFFGLGCFSWGCVFFCVCVVFWLFWFCFFFFFCFLWFFVLFFWGFLFFLYPPFPRFPLPPVSSSTAQTLGCYRRVAPRYLVASHRLFPFLNLVEDSPPPLSNLYSSFI